MTAIAILHRERIIEEVAKGRYLSEIARDLGLKGKGQSISDYLAHDPEYKEARVFGLEAKLVQRESDVEAAHKDDVPRARELLSHARWRAEREAREIWGKGPDVVINTGLTIDQALGDNALTLLDKMRTVSVQVASDPLDSPSVDAPVEGNGADGGILPTD